jgi:predicted TIM-barrel fold metal-dependent hydrolase
MGLPGVEVNQENQWRLQTPGSADWLRSPHAGAANKYFMLSSDTHAIEPFPLWLERIDPKYRDRLPRQEERDGKKWLIQEGAKPFPITDTRLEGEDAYRQKPPVDLTQRLRDMDLDGVDHEILFPNRGSVMYATHDAEFAMAQMRVYNDWVMETHSPRPDRFTPVAVIFTGNLQAAVEEISRAVKLGFKAINIPPKPVFGPHERDHLNYNAPEFDPMWALIQDSGLAVTMHVGSGMDPRIAKGPGGAIVNYAVHALTPAAEPVANLCASGVFDRFPKLRVVTVEAGIGWVPWFLAAMDEAYRKHHFWVKPKLRHGLPSDYYRAHCASTFAEDLIGLKLGREFDLLGNFFWATDYPHNEGSFPHSAEAIERQMGGLTESERGNVLGLNAAKFFKVEVPSRFRVAN